ncbi:VCBS repeat-containing protein [Phanerochaete sordida]|uniref:VCBS repeat-containing protein n=1 Tax=Phanerochaete sordida TaxID=48140 RepID=A0A9P3G2U6_9APHY|nr:VCBS repeat-containing protein [Phanerochaete sordida]
MLPELLLLTLSLSTLQADAIWPFPPKRFSGNSMLSAGAMGVDSNDRVIAFGDFNGDQFLDLVAVGPDQQELAVYIWDHEAYTFVKSSTFMHRQKVLNVVPGDFTQDGKLDMLVMGQDHSQVSLQVYLGLPQGGFNLDPVSAPASAQAQPIPMDLNGDLKIDLVGTVPSAPSDGQFKVWRNTWNASRPASMFNLTDPNFSGSQCRLSNPHSNAAVDLNGDCLADLFLVCDYGRDKQFQIWVNNKDKGFSLAQVGTFPPGLQTVSFADVDRDGTIDMLFTTCSSVSSSTGIGSGCAINVAYNRQLPLCASATTPSMKNGRRVCRQPQELCVADPDFQFNLHAGADNPDFASTPATTIFPGATPALLVLDTSVSPAVPLPIKLGDANHDGFPDMLAVVASDTGRNSDRTPMLAFSVPCGKGVAGCAADGSGRRGWSVLKKGAEVLSAIKDAKGMAFLDLDEDGTLDIMVQRTDRQGEGNIVFVQNNFYFDAFFLKAIVLNGACGSGMCSAPNSSLKYHPFGVSYSGATYKYTVLDTTGKRSAAAAAQLPQTGYQSLLTPYSYFGLGRTNNYIENMFVGSTLHSEEHFINMEGVIPNSKVVIIPPVERDGSWRKELYLRPGEWIVWVTVAVVGATIILAIITFVLHLNEKREDELERRRASHHINFDAL